MLPNITKVSFHERAKRMISMITNPIKVQIIIAMFIPNPFLIIVMSDESQLKNSPIFFSSKNETSLCTRLAKTSLLRFLEILSLMIEKHKALK